MTDQTNRAAAGILDRLAALAAQQRISRGATATGVQLVGRPAAVDDARGGPQLSIVGALWAAAGMPEDSAGDTIPGVSCDARTAFLETQPTLKAAYAALNLAAAEHAAERNLDLQALSGLPAAHGALERLYEAAAPPASAADPSPPVWALTDEGLAAIIAVARERLTFDAYTAAVDMAALAHDIRARQVTARAGDSDATRLAGLVLAMHDWRMGGGEDPYATPDTAGVDAQAIALLSRCRLNGTSHVYTTGPRGRPAEHVVVIASVDGSPDGPEYRIAPDGTVTS